MIPARGGSPCGQTSAGRRVGPPGAGRATRAGRMARLILATAEGQQAIDLRPINSLGRHPNNTIQLLDKIVSKEHCILEQRDGHFILRDLGSLNGTYVNGERVRGETVLKHGDEIALGSTRARYDDGSGAAPPPPAVGPGAVQHASGSMPSARQPSPTASSGLPPTAAMAAAASSSPQPVADRHASYHPPLPPPPAIPAAAPPRPPNFAGTRVDVLDAARAIGTQIAAHTKGFLQFDAVGHDQQQL